MFVLHPDAQPPLQDLGVDRGPASTMLLPLLAALARAMHIRPDAKYRAPAAKDGHCLSFNTFLLIAGITLRCPGLEQRVVARLALPACHVFRASPRATRSDRESDRERAILCRSTHAARRVAAAADSGHRRADLVPHRSILAPAAPAAHSLGAIACTAHSRRSSPGLVCTSSCGRV